MEKQTPLNKQDYEGKIGEEIWSAIAAGMDSGAYTEAEAVARYRQWLKIYRLGKLASDNS